MKFFVPINVVALIIRINGSPRTCEDLLLHLVVRKTLPIILSLQGAVPERVQSSSFFIKLEFDWNQHHTFPRDMDLKGK